MSDSDSSWLERTIRAAGLEGRDGLGLAETITPEALRREVSVPAKLPRIAVTTEAAPVLDAALEIGRVIGAGGMGTVHLARDVALDREVAVKTTRDPTSADDAHALRVEARALGRLEHPGVVPVHQLAQSEDGRPVLVMKRIEGTTWRSLILDPEHPSWSRLRVARDDRERFHLDVLARVSDALAFAHSRGVVHRDVKPDNVMVGSFGEVYLVDWGIAVASGSRSEGLAGTPLYMAPEMARGAAVDARTDVYLLGATLHEVLTGAPPHRGQHLHAVLFAALEAAPPTFAREIDPELAALCARAMAREPADRPADAGAFADAIRGIDRRRAARALTRSADTIRAELAARLAGAIDPPAIPDLYARLAEVRFAYREALREQHDHDPALRAARACDELAVAIEIARREPVAARRALSALEAPPPELALRVDALERELAGSRAEDLRVRGLAALVDPASSPRARWIAGLAATAVGLGATAWAIATHDETAGARRSLAIGVVSNLLMIAAVAFVGRPLWASPFNRRIVAWGAATMAAITLDRAVAVVAGVSHAALMMHDLVVLSAALAAGAIWSLRLLGIGAITSAIGAIAIAIWPRWSAPVFGIALVIAIALVPASARHARRREAGRA